MEALLDARAQYNFGIIKKIFRMALEDFSFYVF